MIAFILINLFPVIKLFLFIVIRIFLIKNTFSKCIIIFLLLTILHLIIVFPKKKLCRLSNLRRFKLNLIYKYKLDNKINHIYDVIVLFAYFMLFIVIVFVLRILNKDKSLNLIAYYTLIEELIHKTPWLDIIINGTLFILILVIYFILMMKLVKYFKLHILKRHIFNMNPKTNFWYQTKFFHGFLWQKNAFNLHRILRENLKKIYTLFYFNYCHKDYGINFDSLSYNEKINIWMNSPVEPSCLLLKYPQIHTMLEQILLKGHYILLIGVLSYDIVYNDFVISKIFHILPFTFFYEVYVRISLFVDNLHLPYDEKINQIIYAQSIELYDNDLILINGEFHDYAYIKKIYKTYIERDFIKDKDDIY